MLSLPENLMNKALAMLVEGITGVDYEAPDLVTPVARLSQKIEALDFVLQAFDEHVRKLVLPMRRQINELLPIHKLPNELLAEVFLEACDGHRAPTRLAAVASRWRSIAISYPRLWHYLNSDSDIRSTSLTLQRSGSTPLDLFCSCKSKSEAEEFFELLAPQSTRWRSIEFNYLDEDGVSLDFLVGQSYPLLEELILPTWGESPDNTLSHHNLDIIAPSIREVDAIKYPLPLRVDHGTHSMLTVLSFTANIDGFPFFPIDYHSLLTSTPYLQDLAIRGFSRTDYLEPEVAAPLQIGLQHLETLQLNALQYKTVGFLLSSIVTPPNCYPEVAVGDMLYGSLSAMFSLPPIENSLLAGFARGDQATLMSFTPGVDVNTQGGAAGTRKCLLKLTSLESQSQVEDNLSNIITTLLPGIRELEIDGVRMLLYGLGDHLHLLPRLEKISFHSNSEDDYLLQREALLERIITLIASRSSPNQSSPAICPLLRHIVLGTFYFNLDCLLDLVVARTTERDGEFQHGPKGRLELVELGEMFDLEDPKLKLLHQLASERNFELRVGKLQKW